MPIAILADPPALYALGSTQQCIYVPAKSVILNSSQLLAVVMSTGTVRWNVPALDRAGLHGSAMSNHLRYAQHATALSLMRRGPTSSVANHVLPHSTTVEFGGMANQLVRASIVVIQTAQLHIDTAA